MSHIMEKTLASIPKLLTQSLMGGGSAGGGGGGSKPNTRSAPAMDVQNFMRHIHRARSKSHEAQIVQAEISSLQDKLKQKDMASSPSFLHGCFTKILFCHLLGYNVSFIVIHAVNLAQQGRGFNKRLGYLVSCLLLSPHHEMVMLMMATILRDIKSSNMVDNCIALKVAGELVDTDNIPSILPEVIRRFSHQHELVREKAIHCFAVFYQRSPEILSSEIWRLKTFLASRDPGVLMAVVNIFVRLTCERPSSFVGLGSSFLHILSQINSRGFGSSYYYNMIPLPWLQISLLKVLGNLGREDYQLSAKIWPVLQSLIENTKVSIPISLAVLVESILTATKIHSNDSLLQLCSRCIMKLLSSGSSQNMQYQGLGLLIALSKIKPSFATQHQMAVIECLTNEDPTIQTQTTHLLHAMANRANVKPICSKLFEQLEKAKDAKFCCDIFMMISDLAESLFPDIEWYFSIKLKILSHELPQSIHHKISDLILQKIEKISCDSSLIERGSLDNLTELLISVLEKRNFDRAEFSLAVQCLGLLAPVIDKNAFSPDRFLDAITSCIRYFKMDVSTEGGVPLIYSPHSFNDSGVEEGESNEGYLMKLKSQCVMTVTKMFLCDHILSSSVKQWLNSMKGEMEKNNSFLLSDLEDLYDLVENPQNLENMKAAMFSRNEQTIDFSLSFLDSLVVRDMMAGNDCYKPLYIRHQEALGLSVSQMSMSTSEDADLQTSHEDESSLDKSDQSNTEKKTLRKWREDNFEDSEINSEEWSIHLSSSVEKDLDKKKAAEELFAGLDDESECDLGQSHERSDFLTGSTVIVKTGKALWDDDDEEEEKDYVVDNNFESAKNEKSHSIFNMGSIGLNPFGISKKAKPKSSHSQWDDHSSLQDIRSSNAGVSIMDLGRSSENNNNEINNCDEYVLTNTLQQPQSMYSVSSNAIASYSVQDLPWSEVKEELPKEVLSSSMYSSQATDSVISVSHSCETMSGSTVDALTDSDPELPS